MRSIKRELTIYLSLGIVLMIGLWSVLSYHAAEDELGELYDANMAHLASAMMESVIEGEEHGSDVVYGLSQPKLQGEQDYLIQLMRHQHILYQSHQGVFKANIAQTGLTTQRINHKRWRVFVLNKNGMTSVIAQDDTLRQRTIRQVAMKLIIPQLLVIPLLILGAFFIIQKTFNPLTAMSAEMAKRQVGDLKLLDDRDQPRELMPIIRSLNEWMRNVHRFITQRKQFMTDAAHELRTPVTAMKLQLSALVHADPQVLQERLPRALESVQRMERLVEQLLTLSKVEPDNQTSLMGEVNLNALIVKVLNNHRTIFMAKRQDVGMTYSEEISITGVADELEIMLNNLLINAINYTPNDGIINIQLRSLSHAAEIEIEDSGPGIDAEQIDKVFERFYRATHANVPGSGLGLSIAREIALKHHAEIRLSNKPTDAQGLIVKVVFHTSPMI